VIFQHHARKTLMAVGLAAFLLTGPGCLFSPESGKGGGGGNDDRVPERTSVTGAIELFSFVWEQRRLDLYQQLLHDAFEFIPQDADADDFPWVTPDDPWERTDELGMAANMFDSNFVSQETGNSVDSIEMKLTITNERSVAEGVEVTTTADITVLWDTNAGATSDVRFIFTVVPDPDEPGLFQVIRQQELPAF